MKLFSILALCLHFMGMNRGIAFGMEHYVFFNMERERIHEATFLNTKAFAGAQLKYTWRELEPKPNAYDFSSIRKDLGFLRSKRKKLFIQLQDVTFSPSYICIPKYLLEDSRYHGGADKQYSMDSDNEELAVAQGWVARRWDPAVRERYHKLL